MKVTFSYVQSLAFANGLTVEREAHLFVLVDADGNPIVGPTDLREVYNEVLGRVGEPVEAEHQNA